MQITKQTIKSPDEEIAKLMKDHYLEQDEAEEVKELMDETGLDEDDAVELKTFYKNRHVKYTRFYVYFVYFSY